jgi:hypothetical protein
MKIGAKILDTIDEAIRLRDKVLLILSDASLASEWVEDEVTWRRAGDRRSMGGKAAGRPARMQQAGGRY